MHSGKDPASVGISICQQFGKSMVFDHSSIVDYVMRMSIVSEVHGTELGLEYLTPIVKDGLTLIRNRE